MDPEIYQIYKIYEMDIQNMFQTVINELNNCKQDSDQEILIEKFNCFNRIKFTFIGYQAIKRLQKRMKRRFKIKNDASRIIGR